MTEVHFTDQVVVHKINIELTNNVTTLFPLDGVVIQFGFPQTTDELEIPPAPLSLGLDRDTALRLAVALYQKATQK